MDETNFPPIDAALLATLNQVFPEQSPQAGETMEALMFRGGQRQVIQFLQEHHRRQNETVLEQQVT